MGKICAALHVARALEVSCKVSKKGACEMCYYCLCELVFFLLLLLMMIHAFLCGVICLLYNASDTNTNEALQAGLQLAGELQNTNGYKDVIKLKSHQTPPNAGYQKSLISREGVEVNVKVPSKECMRIV